MERIAGDTEPYEITLILRLFDHVFAGGKRQAYPDPLFAITDAIGLDSMSAKIGSVGARSAAGIGMISETAAKIPAAS